MSSYPKMVYPGVNKDEMSNPGSGITVENEDQEKWVMDGKKLEDFGKDDTKPAGWTADK